MRVKEFVGHDLKLPQRATDKITPLGLLQAKLVTALWHSCGWMGWESVSEHHTLLIQFWSGTGQATSSPWPASPAPTAWAIPSLGSLPSPTFVSEEPGQPPVPDSPQGVCEQMECAVTPQSQF